MCVTSVTIHTITPIFTGDAYGKYNGLKPQSILGSLRFWFEVYCYATGKLEEDYCEEINNAEFTKILRDIVTQNNSISLTEAKKETLKRLKVSLPSQFFGCSGWEGLIKIKEIDVKNNKQVYVPRKIYKNKNNSGASWFFPEKYFFGVFKIKFLLSDESLKKEFLYPLLYFIEKYGFIGAKNNIGFGRVNVSLKNDELSLYKSFNLSGKVKDVDDAVKIIDVKEITEKKETEKFSSMLDKLVEDKKIGLLRIGEITEEDPSKYFAKIIEKLIKKKSSKRHEFKENSNNEKKRHYIFGSTAKDEYENIKGPNATKIIPWINKIENNKYETGFVSLVLLENFPQKWGEKVE